MRVRAAPAIWVGRMAVRLVLADLAEVEMFVVAMACALHRRVRRTCTAIAE